MGERRGELMEGGKEQVQVKIGIFTDRLEKQKKKATRCSHDCHLGQRVWEQSGEQRAGERASERAGEVGRGEEEEKKKRSGAEM